MTAQLEHERREEASAFDLIEHAGYHDFLKDVVREAKAARAVLFSDEASDAERAHARGSLKVVRNLVLGVYRRANREVPPNVSSLFE